ncbi:MAG: hypothetical protein JSS11_09060 [Verrucomicrobia bacterium]|nr:hypothetical protein [Verrucomicrobiota bacterium]
MTGGVNALCWERTLHGDFAAVARALARGEEMIVKLDAARLGALTLDGAGREAAGMMLEDFARLRELGLQPELNAIWDYPRDAEGIVPTDVFSWHVDSATEPADTWLCTYFGAASEGLPNAAAVRRVDVAETRAALLREFDGDEGAAFEEWLAENCYDLHYAARPGARPWAFGVGHFWRIAAQYEGAPVPPCIHRAPATVPGAGPRLLLIS